MPLCTTTMFIFIFFFFFFFSVSTQSENNSFSLSFPLTSLSLSPNTSANLFSNSLFLNPKQNPRIRRTGATTTTTAPSYNYKFSFKYSMALIVSLPIGTPPQTQQMVLDTGSQLSWIQCHKKAPRKPPPTASFDPSLSSSFSVLPCTHPLCKPRVPDFTLPTSCDQNRLCHYSYFYADGTLAEGNLVKEKFSFSRSVSTPPLILGCATDSTSDTQGILGMNIGRLSFASQAKISKFSYCVPTRHSQPVGMQGIRIGGKRLNIPPSVFRPNAGGAGQTMIDSGSDFTFLVDDAYKKVREEVVRLAGPKLKKDYVYGAVADMCFDGNAMEIGRLIGDMVFEFDKGVEIVIPKDQILAEVDGGVPCLGIGRSDMLGAASNIIGNFHQQNLWVEFDLVKRRVGFGKADCSRSV
ncbi:aspartic proteinase PCS1 [Quillaja saponaria]|uniref:Aspartic proteinase PCS1 n=1 Tax=Quillaja saponaria TaxID=32244 RepID=A0AAD7LUC4_QUISA|nr:aspartic proteinase PCS1 [Quillaja saponaria]